MRKATRLLAGLLTLMLVATVPFQVSAAEPVLQIEKKEVQIPLTGGTTVNISYQCAFSDLELIIGNPDVVAASLTDFGGGKAVLAIAAKDIGYTLVGVVQKSDTKQLVFTQVRSGMTPEGQVVTVSDGVNNKTVYHDFYVEYQNVMHGKNDASFAIESVEVDTQEGMNELTVSANVLTDDSVMPGLATVYANFYNQTGALIKRQAAYVRTNLNRTMNIVWYIPEDCVTISIE